MHLYCLLIHATCCLTLDLIVDGNHGSLLNRSNCVFLIHTSVPTCILLNELAQSTKFVEENDRSQLISLAEE